MSFQFKSAAQPSDDAFDLMARGGSLLTGKGAATALRLLRQSYTAARAERLGVATVSSDGLFVTCILPPDGGGVNFMVASDWMP